MKRIVLLFVAMLVLTGCDDVNSYEYGRKVSRSDQDVANMTVARLHYFKDPRTGLCFANHCDRIFLVPEEKIPKGMLFTADVSE